MEYSVPKQIQGSKFYTQTIWDEKNKTGYFAILTKKSNGDFERKTDDFLSDAIKKLNLNKKTTD